MSVSLFVPLRHLFTDRKTGFEASRVGSHESPSDRSATRRRLALSVERAAEGADPHRPVRLEPRVVE